MLVRTNYTNDLEKLIDKEVVLSGWVHDVRILGGINFILLRDSGGIVQVTGIKDKIDKRVLEIFPKLHQEDVISVRGKVVRSKVAKIGLEVIPSEIELVSKSAVPLPLDPREVTPALFDTRMDNRVMDLRKPENLAIFRIQSKIMAAMREFLEQRGFVNVNTPALMGGASESGAEVFRVDYFGMNAFLRQDPQLHRQLLMLAGFDKVYDLGPSWRAELSFTTRHMTEFRSCAAEMAFIKDEADVMKLQEEMVIHTVKKVAENCTKDLKLLKKDLQIPKKGFPELRFPDVYKILEEKGHKVVFGEEYDREGEVTLANFVKEKYKHDFFFVNRFPSAAKPFYVMKTDEHPQWARSVDLIYKGLEQSSGGQREHRYEKIISQIREKKLDVKQLTWFTEPFKFGAPPHGGFAIGIERFTEKLLDLENVREATPFARDPKRLLP